MGVIFIKLRVALCTGEHVSGKCIFLSIFSISVHGWTHSWSPPDADAGTPPRAPHAHQNGIAHAGAAGTPTALCHTVHFFHHIPSPLRSGSNTAPQKEAGSKVSLSRT